VLTENTQKEGDSEAAAGRTARRTAVQGESESERTERKKKEGNTLIFDTMLSSTRRHVRVEEAAKVSEMCRYARQRCAARTGKVKKNC
jgi:hypothetical protein